MAATQKKTAAKPAFEIAAEMEFTKSTKGTHVFTDSNENAPVTTLYIQRSAFQGDPPANITLNITEAAG